MKPNKMKAKIQAGQPALGVSVMFPSPQIVEMIGALGFDWVLIDCEHGTIDVESVELMVMAAEGLLRGNAAPDERAIRHGLAGNLCRCTGYQLIIEAVAAEAARRADDVP